MLHMMLARDSSVHCAVLNWQRMLGNVDDVRDVNAMHMGGKTVMYLNATNDSFCSHDKSQLRL